MSKQFRIAYVVEKGKLHDISALEPYVDEIKYILKGNEQDDEIANTLRTNFIEFNSNLDVIIPTGRVISSFILGYLMGHWSEIIIGIYRNKDYNFLHIWPEI